MLRWKKIGERMQIVLNSSPLIFLAKLDYLETFLEIPARFYVPQSVVDEIAVKSDPSSQTVTALINAGKLQVRSTRLVNLVSSLKQRLGKGESEAIALGIELEADYVLLDDSTASLGSLDSTPCLEFFPEQRQQPFQGVNSRASM